MKLKKEIPVEVNETSCNKNATVVSQELTIILNQKMPRFVSYYRYDTDGVVWDLRHNKVLTNYIIKTVPSSIPLQAYEIYYLWQSLVDLFYNPKFETVNDLVDKFVSWLISQENPNKSLRSHETQANYNVAMNAYKEKELEKAL